MTRAPRTRSDYGRGLLVVLGLALGIRLIYIHQLSANPFFEYPIVDSATYDGMAQRIARGEAPCDEPFFQPPLYPYFLGLLYWLLGRDFFAVRFAQMLMGVVNCGLTYTLARRVFGRRIAIWSGIAAALYGTGLFFEGELLAPVLIVFLNLLLAQAILGVLDRPSPVRAAVCGLLLGLSAIAMTVILPFALVIGIYGWTRLRTVVPRRSLMSLGAAFILGIVMPIMPVTGYNFAHGDPVLISTNGGVNFYIGTGKDYDEKVAIRPGFAWQAMGQEPMKAGYRTPSQQSAYFTKKALGIIADDPTGYAGLLVKKLYLYAHGNEVLRNQEIYPFRHYSWLLALLLWKSGIAFPYGTVFPLAMVGMALAIRQRVSSAIPMVLFMLSHIGALLLFFIAARYRGNILPFLLIFGAHGIATLAEMVKVRKWRSLAGYGLLLAAILVISNWRVGPMPSMFNADAYYNLGVAYMKEGRPEARETYEKALILEPDYPEANSNLGAMLDQAGEHQRAIECFNRVLIRYPDDVESNLNLGNALFNLGDIEGARAQFLKVLALQPRNQLALNNLAVLARRREQPPPALPPLPFPGMPTPMDEAASLTNRAAELLKRQQYAEAAELLHDAVQLCPDLPQAHNNLGIALAELGDLSGARREFEAVLRLDPTNRSARANLTRMDKREDEME
ncbi:tetratricopeptide repeat protein [Candidatus Fermentibacteria bacterium]|nr:tetratricopeptide repeat protein [Candidatus Fermentibacteria bacterium]